MLLDALGLVALFGGTAVLALGYYRLVPPGSDLRQRFPNRVSLASLLLTALIGLGVWWLWQAAEGFGRIRVIIGTLFNLLIFETLFLFLARWLRSNALAVLISATATAGMIWLQREVGTTLVFNLTFILATFGATTLLIRLDYLRTKFLVIVAGLWMFFDIMSVAWVYPQIYRITDRPHTSFVFPAVASGRLTLGSGDFMFLVLMSLVLLRDRGQRVAMLHILLQAMALLITIYSKSRDSLFPYLTIMVPIFLAVWWWSKPKPTALPAAGSKIPEV